MTRLIDGDLLKSKISSIGFPYIDRNGRIDKYKIYELINGSPIIEERQKGKWIFDIYGYMICTNCGCKCSYNEEGMYIRGSYCYNCGAYMGRADNGQ